ncbi:hypothetical protein N7456_001089 [Penicillium angulare]|uniref:Uncharacterized protein n=1 Tax=Penicillium angulare TaxID=116970 RepID=A0A9W9GDD0_9EURO|nr:hypothetical protein N7456_001089 [Penicillium angulare]
MSYPFLERVFQEQRIDTGTAEESLKDLCNRAKYFLQGFPDQVGDIQRKIGVVSAEAGNLHYLMACIKKILKAMEASEYDEDDDSDSDDDEDEDEYNGRHDDEYTVTTGESPAQLLAGFTERCLLFQRACQDVQDDFQRLTARARVLRQDGN